MRVTTYIAQQRRLSDILRNQERLEDARDRVSTGKRIRRPSDEPDEIGDLLRLRAQATALERRKSALDVALPQMRAADTALGDIASILREARTAALASGGVMSASQRGGVADQIGRLRVRLVDAGNAQVGGRYLFGGTVTDTAPFSPGPPVTYSGNNTPLEVETAPESTFQVSMTGLTLMDASGGTDLFQNMEDLETAIRNGDSAGIETTLARMDQDLQRLNSLRGDNGARIAYLQTAADWMDRDLLTTRNNAADLENADMAEAILEAKSAEAAQEATLAMAARLESPSLLDYLR